MSAAANAPSPLKQLTTAERAQYDAFGCVHPISILSATEVGHYQARLHEFMATAGALDPSTRHKPHLFLKWVADLVRHPVLLDAVEDVLGPDLLIWRCLFSFKPARGESIGWHRDSVYGRLSSDHVATAWIALTDNSIESGCVRFRPGSHRAAQEGLARRFFSKDRAGSDDGRTANAELRAGEASLHQLHVLHGSWPNHTDDVRCGLVVRYIPARLRQTGAREGASLVRGTDPLGNFDHEPQPRFDNDPLVLPWHAKSLRHHRIELVRETLLHPTPSRLLTSARMLTNGANARFVLRWLTRTGKRFLSTDGTTRPKGR